jgi:hypothetical protein
VTNEKFANNSVPNRNKCLDYQRAIHMEEREGWMDMDGMDDDGMDSLVDQWHSWMTGRIDAYKTQNEN